MKTLKNQKGFTLVELIVVIAIIGILSAVLIPNLTGYITKARESAALQEVQVIQTAYETFKVELEAGTIVDLNTETITPLDFANLDPEEKAEIFKEYVVEELELTDLVLELKDTTFTVTTTNNIKVSFVFPPTDGKLEFKFVE